MPISSRSYASVLIAACLGLTLSACSGGHLDKVGLNLPDPPKYLEPVAVPYGTAETDARELAVQRRHAIEEANSRIIRGRDAWAAMKRKVAHPK